MNATTTPSLFERLFAAGKLKERQARLAAEAALAEARRQLAEADAERQNGRGVLAAVDEAYAYIEFDLGGHVLTANRNFLGLLGYTLDEIVGRHHRTFVDPVESGSPAYGHFWADLNAGKAKSQVFKRVTKAGQEVWIQAVYAPVKDGQGAVRKIVKIATDVTQTRLQAADYEGQINAVSKAQAVIEFTLDGRVITANDNFLDTVGYTLAEVKGQHHSIFVEPAHRASVEYRQFWEKLGRGDYDAGQYQRIAKSGQPVWIQASYNPIFGLDGKPFKVVKYATDVTAEVKATQMLRLAVEQAQKVAAAAQAGDLSQRIPMEGKSGPIGEMCEGFNDLLETTSAVFDDIGRIFGGLASGDLTQRICAMCRACSGR